MHKWLLVLIIFHLTNSLQAQLAVTLRIKNLPVYHKTEDQLFIAGSFNNWNPGQKEFQLEKNVEGNYFITLAIQKGKHEFKITKGSWETVESGNDGVYTENRIAEISGDTTIEISIQHWADHFPKKAKASTANKHVKIIETAFSIPQLNRYRRIWIYLPETYATSKKDILYYICTTAKMYLMTVPLFQANGVLMKHWIL